MTLDEAIKHAQSVADTNCGQCAEDHRQLAEWLKELKELRNDSGLPVIELSKECDKVKITRDIHLDSQTQSSIGDINI